MPGRKITSIELRSAGCSESLRVQKMLEKKAAQLGFKLEVTEGGKEPVVVVGDFEFSQATTKQQKALMDSLETYRHLFPKGA